jgi:hypothetical protein
MSLSDHALSVTIAVHQYDEVFVLYLESKDLSDVRHSFKELSDSSKCPRCYVHVNTG